MKIKHTNIIIGAGPAGIQCAYFFKKYNIPYIILEKSDRAASFFKTFPHSGKLISINKKHVVSDNNDFRLRHDWNSLLNDDDHLFTNYSDEFYPNREELFEYLNDFVLNNDLNVFYNKTVFKIMKDNDEYYIFIENTKEIYICNKLIIATGISQPHIPNFKYNIPHIPKHYYEYETDYFKKKHNLVKYEGKNVVIIGDGNSAYEIGNILLPYTNKTLIVGKKYKNNWSISSHYAGGLRSNYFAFMDSFYLKSLNAIADFNIVDEENIIISIDEKGKYNAFNSECKFYAFENMDEIILCTGWKFNTSIFDFTIDMNNKYPQIKNNFESTSHNNLFFIGALMHSIDYKKSSGGFIHGFRYLINIFVKLNYNIPFTNCIYKMPDDITCIVEKIMYRINNSSDLYQMFGYICDILILNTDESELVYFENMIDSTIDTNNNFYMFYIQLQYGNSTNDIRELPTKKTNIGYESHASFIHPVIVVKKNNILIEQIHFNEDIFAEFLYKPMWYDRIIRLLKSYI
jgi:thioredoxin reductase